jgi:hypothetical protein
VVVDALSQKKYCNTTFAKRMQPKLRREIEYLNLDMVNESKVTMEVETTLEVEIREGQLEDAKLKEIQQLLGIIRPVISWRMGNSQGGL